ncbi:MAG TPA: tryptophan--tRNA ligase [Streptosporangiaceae bacterium]|nr:tryptophan--tRNA ligase [Streptosporangiaceae bacterium]
MTTLEATSPAGAAQRRSAELEQAIAADPGAFRILTGDRPTGPMHIGHYFGTLQNRVRLQQAGVELLVLIADYQALTDRTATAQLPDVVLGIVADYLAIGIDPERATIFAHSQVAALNQLLLPFLSLVSVAEIRRNPTVKEEMAAAGSAGMTGLMFAYPVHQAADILACRANLVPVGRDQLPHLELSRVIARRFNERYSPDAPYFAEPEALLSSAPLLRGLDGRKMGKSLGNAVPLRATADQTARLVARAVTDSQRLISYDPLRRPEVSGLLLIAALCRDEPPEAVAEAIGDGGAAALKAAATAAINDRFAPIRARRAGLAAEPGYLREVLAAGNERARMTADATLRAVRGLMHTSYEGPAIGTSP